MVDASAMSDGAGAAGSADERGEMAEAGQPEQYFRLIAESANDVIWHNRPDGAMAWISPSVTRVLGWRQDELVGRPMTDFIHPDDQTTAMRGRTRATVGLSAVAEVRIQRSDGSWCPMEVRGGPYVDGTGSSYGTVAIGRDNSIVRSSRNRLQESERRFRVIAELADRLSHLTELSALTAEAAAVVARQVGDACVISLLEDEHLSPVAVGHLDAGREAALRPLLEIAPVPWAQAVSGPALAVRRSMQVAGPDANLPGEGGRILGEYLGHFGTSGMVLVPLVVEDTMIGSLVASRDGSSPSYTREESELLEEIGRRVALHVRNASLRDSLARTRSELQAGQEVAEHTFRTAMHEAPIGMAITNSDGQVLEVNRALCAIVGYEADELATRTLEDITHPDDRGGDADQTRQLLAGDIPASRTVKRLIRKDGRTIWVDVATSAVRTASHDPVRFVTQVLDVDATRRAQDALEFQARHDPLTGLLNRSELLNALSERSSELRRPGPYFALFFCDLDHFKAVNDTLGHAAGDAVLRAAAARVRLRVRAGDVVARMGGDEFVVVLDAVHTVHEAGSLAQQMLDTVAQPVALPAPAGVVTPTVSIGVVVASAGAVVDRLLATADQALYEAKAAGRARVVVHPDIME